VTHGVSETLVSTCTHAQATNVSVTPLTVAAVNDVALQVISNAARAGLARKICGY
jgi:hypothetical protein